MYLGSALNPINSSVIATALVSIAAELGVPVGRTAILISSLYLTSAIAQPTAGRLAEQFGPRRIFLAGISIVLVGGLVGGFGQSLGMLVVSRVLIGLGTSAGYPSAMLLIRRRAADAGLDAPPGGVLGGIAIAGAATVAIGPTIGGLLVGAFDWRAAFFINVPFTLVAFAMAWSWIPPDPDILRGRSLTAIARQIDVVGVIGFGGSMTALLVFLLGLPHAHWLPLALAVALAIALVTWELRADNPFIDVRLLVSNMALTRTYLRQALTLLGTYTILYGLTQWMEASYGVTAFHAGLLLIPMGVLAALVARVISQRPGVRGPLLLAAVLQLIGAVAVLLLTGGSPVIAIVGVTALFGLASGLSNLSNQTALYQSSPASTIGTASGLLRTFGYVGSIASATLTGVVFRTRVDDVGLHRVALILIGIGAIVLLMTAADRSLTTRRVHVAPREEELA